MAKMVDMAGLVVGRLTVLRRAPNAKSGAAAWWCKCECGFEVPVNGQHLRQKNGTRSCGCLGEEVDKKGLRSKTHGMSGTSELSTYWSMMRRCYKPKDNSYKYYGGRGITVCKRWRNSFQNFYEDMGNKPEGMTLERKNNEKGYSKNNCKWATRTEQSRNRRNIRLIRMNGRSQCLSAWCEELNLNPETVANRRRKGMTIQQALLKPNRPSPPIS